jgi:hypothetical protein
MILDVVLSRQRRYQERVLPLVARWEADNEAYSLRWLAGHEPDQRRYGLRSGESATVAALARNLITFVDGRGLGEDEDEGCRLWAQGVVGLEHAPGLDPVAGSVPGIGPALFAYLRMRSGADALKPDLRVARALRKLGFHVPVGEHAILVVAHAAADEAAVSLLVLDQLLWWLALSATLRQVRETADMAENPGAVAAVHTARCECLNSSARVRWANTPECRRLLDSSVSWSPLRYGRFRSVLVCTAAAVIPNGR